MTRLRQQAQGIINVCKTALAGRGKEQHAVDNQTVAIAQAILAEAKAALPDDRVLSAVTLQPPILYWTTLQTAMETVVSTLPTEKEAKEDEEVAKALKDMIERRAKKPRAAAEVPED